ncbi:MAG: hypothetical protein ACTSSQ_04625 [Alphaproteobacteria bacterium]
MSGAAVKPESQLLDQAHLDRRTGHSAGLQVEILSLFLNEGERLVAQIGSASDTKVRQSRVAALGALANQTGARQLAAACRTAEIGPRVHGESLTGDSKADVSALEAAFAEVSRHILTAKI